MDLWTQFYLMDSGETFTKNFYYFRNIFFTKFRAPWGVYSYNFKKKLEPIVAAKIKNRSIRYEEEEVIECNKYFSSIEKLKQVIV